MGKNNNNAGMHFVRHSDYGKYDDLAYYDRNSTEGIANRRYEAIANLEAKGEYLFTRSVSFIQILIEDSEFDLSRTYKVLIYDKEDEKKLKAVSTIKKLNILNDEKEQEIRVREHNTQRIIYITSELYEEKKHTINLQMVYKLK